MEHAICRNSTSRDISVIWKNHPIFLQAVLIGLDALSVNLAAGKEEASRAMGVGCVPIGKETWDLQLFCAGRHVASQGVCLLTWSRNTEDTVVLLGFAWTLALMYRFTRVLAQIPRQMTNKVFAHSDLSFSSSSSSSFPASSSSSSSLPGRCQSALIWGFHACDHSCLPRLVVPRATTGTVCQHQHQYNS
ncbi:hypothetical protein M430DRAFT_15640 [Amorphotheca resinae ATCC 22711]|uniref:Uncharacterized protein n=1 Tax=Amorphotheca resinae ATCC 22711 TaxID=857342 RepID=A0A2T3BG94_AMORE|nr:hypothetical protein M430DRAFT_15640 [Amorphotheca resinae ATCC 22711]PSS28426.1 hypothetical protein M430DRAFT_15640 [Amorphotheca resinae ATCC 22711]